MKKFLFTLAALLMAGSVCAEEYLYIEDFEVAQAELGTEIEVAVKAHYDYAVSAWQIKFTMPEGMEITGCEQGEDMTISYLNSRGKAATLTAPLYGSGVDYITAVADAGYNEDKTTYGCVKWLPGDYEEMLIVYIEVAEDFKGGEIILNTQPACGEDSREDVTPCPKGQNIDKVCTVTVEGGEVIPEVTETPVISYDAETFTVTATGNGEVKLYVNGEEVENPYTFEQTEEEVTYTVTATAQEEGKEISETATATIVVPAKEVVPEVTEKPVITTEEVENGVKVIATGNGHICLYVEDILVAEGEGVAEYVIESTELEEEYGVSATAQEEGKEVSEYALATVWVPGLPVVPEPEAPVITVDFDGENYIITATGEGDITLYVDGVEVENPYIIARPENGEDALEIEVVAVATIDGVDYSTDPMPVVVEPKEPVVPQETFVLVIIDQNNEEHFFDLAQGSDGNWTTTVTLDYDPYYQFAWDNTLSDEANKAAHPVPFYFIINGVKYGADSETDVATVLGYAMSNPLAEGEDGLYTVPVGNAYSLGVAIDGDNYYVFAAVANPTSVNELANGKTVAGVRYYNMAGQEMQEANGMTIVVTTYTDGTTNAVKVIK